MVKDLINIGRPKMRFMPLLIIIALVILGGYGMSANREFPVDIYKKGEIAIGFKKGISKEEAEIFLKAFNFKFENTLQINLGKEFFYQSGEKYIVIVPIGEENMWAKRFTADDRVYQASLHPNDEKMLLD